MRLVMATLLPTQVEPVRQALAEVHVTRLSVADAHGFHAGRIAQVAVLEIAVNEDFVERTVSTIAAVLELGNADGDGGASGSPRGVTGLYVLPIADTVQIYRAVRGPEAV